MGEFKRPDFGIFTFSPGNSSKSRETVGPISIFTLSVEWFNSVPLLPGFTFFVRVLPSHALETTFFNFARETDTVKQHETRFEASGMSPSCRYGPFGIW